MYNVVCSFGLSQWVIGSSGLMLVTLPDFQLSYNLLSHVMKLVTVVQILQVEFCRKYCERSTYNLMKYTIKY